MRRFCFKLLLACVLLVAAAGSAAAQTYLFNKIPKDRPQFGLRFMRPDFDQDVDMTSLSGIYDFSVNLPIKGSWSIAGSLPYLTASSGSGDDEGDNGLGNLYIGMQYISGSDEAKSTITSFGAYLPTAEDDMGMTIFGIFTNNRDLGKYAQDMVTFYGNFAYFYNSSSGTRLGLEIGPDVMIYTGDGDGDYEFFVHYGLTGGIALEHFSLMAELIGLAIISEDLGGLGDRTEHSLAFGASYISRHITPGLFYKIYLEEDIRDVVKGVLGINLEVTF